MFFRSKGIVVKRHKLRDNDIILHVFTEKAGIVQLVVQGGRSPKSRHAAACSLFVFGEFEFSTRGSLKKLINVDIIDGFYHIRDDLMKVSYGTYFMELLLQTTKEGQVNKRLFSEVVEAVNLLEKKGTDLALLKIAYEAKIIAISGYKPVLNTCVHTGDTEGLTIFDIENGGMTSAEYYQRELGMVKVGDVIPKIIEYLMSKDLRVSMKTSIHEKYVVKIDSLFSKYMVYHMELLQRPALDFLKTLRI